MEFLGRGWQFPFAFDPASGGIATSASSCNIRQAITVILSTRPGERQGRPEFGCRVHELLFAPQTQATATLAAHHVREALTRWETRIDVVRVESQLDEVGKIRVIVSYRVKSTRELQELQLRLPG